MISVADALSMVKLSREEERSLTKLEAVIDAALSEKFDGAPFVMKFNEPIPSKTAAALQRRYELGGWRINMTADSEGRRSFAFMPTVVQPATTPLSAPSREGGRLPMVPVFSEPQATATTRRVLVRMPTRARPLQAIEVLKKYRLMSGIPVAIEVIIDEDDATMTAGDVLQRLNALGCTITVGQHTSKVDACNGGRVNEWDILLLASDDMVPVADGYATRIVQAMEQHFPHLDGLIYFNDGYQGKNICTLPIFGRRLYDQFAYVYNPAYHSLFCDTEQTELLTAMGRIQYIDECLIEHRHYVVQMAKKDALYERNDAFWPTDQVTYEQRKKEFQPYAQFPFASPPLWLSLCIATVPSRRARLERLLDHIYWQITVDAPREVEVIVDAREGITIGEKRQAMIERAKGHFVAHIDDDDWVSHDYVLRVVNALYRIPDADCASLSGIMTTAGQSMERISHSLKNTEWAFNKEHDTHIRSVNHLNAVRREIALSVGFPKKSYSEDLDFSMQLRERLKKETDTGEAPLYYYWYLPYKQGDAVPR